MPDTDTTPQLSAAQRRGPGRPSTGQALTSTERNRARRERLAAEGKRQISGVTLTPAASMALAQLTAAGATIDQAVSQALEALAARSI